MANVLEMRNIILELSFSLESLPVQSKSLTVGYKADDKPNISSVISLPHFLDVWSGSGSVI